jgi:SHS2 domain-containing protein
MDKDFEIIEHTADAGIRANGSDLKEAFANAAKGMFSLIIEPGEVEECSSVEVKVSASDREGLLVEWLNELLYRFDVDYFLLKRCDLNYLSNVELQATCYGEKVDKSRHHLKTGIKSATFHGLRVEEKDGFQVQVFLDL